MGSGSAAGMALLRALGALLGLLHVGRISAGAGWFIYGSTAGVLPATSSVLVNVAVVTRIHVAAGGLPGSAASVLAAGTGSLAS